MEFKDKLRKLRTERGISQQALSEAIFVSRSAVAKWETGLGFPCEESLEELSKYFGVSKDFWSTEEPESVIVKKNKNIILLKRIMIITAAVILLSVCSFLTVSVISDDYGFTSESVAGGYSDYPCIKTSDYDFYYYTFGGDEGSGYEYIAGFCPVKKLFIGYATFEKDYEYDALFADGNQVGIIYSIKGADGYYNIIRALLTPTGPVHEYFFNLDTITANGKTYNVQVNSFFVTDEPVRELYIGDVKLTVCETENE